MPEPTLRIGVIGAGRVGAVIGAAFRASGHEIVGVSAVSEASRERAARLLPGVPVLQVPDVVAVADVVLLAVPDDEIASLVTGLAATRAWAGGRLAIHFSGFHGVDVLAPVVAAGGDAVALHPVMTFSGTAKDLPRLVGTPMAVTASMGADLVSEALVLDLGGEPFRLAEEQRSTYHAALSHGANHVTTLVAQAQQMLRAAGLDNPAVILRPLIEAAIDNALEHGDRALTGPIIRGDVGTVSAHLDAVSRQPEDIAMAYRAIATATALRAISRRAMPAESVTPMLEILQPKDDEDR
ncbi:Rossmann-like and DUF2520 domain-containing protein [Rudaeicoccus suwonensis]|uniref:Putative short-subunit dehydrogenase-like oxidoreductase (DUF2520 family) n=1 Tax=Rudaeicoccus suwonensis TaxID=657409 RepID=A0A561E2U1_9MICO|nr:DUF2520 domain-containing protein [Rudaeicoccus suwonensis]TWE09937.1 putative short-subunit dehydrogenase-like oxidoreductase (DUF2520 family) [Rudaeicoccus suwonensis]